MTWFFILILKRVMRILKCINKFLFIFNFLTRFKIEMIKKSISSSRYYFTTKFGDRSIHSKVKHSSLK